MKLIFTDIAEKQKQFMKLYEPVHARLNRFVQSLVWNRDDAKDIISETVLTTFEQFDRLRDEEAFLYYLFTISARLVRKKQRRKKFFGIFSDEEAGQLPAASNPEEHLLRKELYAALEKLNAVQREAIVLFEISGFSIREIAVLQHMSESGVKSNLKRGREKLAKLLSEHNEKKMTLPAEAEIPLNLLAEHPLKERRSYGKQS